MRATFSWATLLLVASVAAPVAAEPSRELARTGPWALGAETGGVLVLAVAMDAVSGGAAKETCSWCQPTGFDRWGHDALTFGDRKTVAFVSHVPSFALIPIGALAGVMVPAYRAGEGAHAWQNAWMVVNSFLLTTATASATKQAVARRRPVFYFGHAGDSEFAHSPREENLSFFSGDTAWAFDVAATGATVAYLRGYSTAPWIAGIGGALAVGTATLRVASEAHWPTDVLAGAAIGTGIGIATPLLLHRRSTSGGPSVMATGLVTSHSAELRLAGSF